MTTATPAAAAADPILLRARKIGKVFPGTTALTDVNFDVYRGAVNVLVGENGAGKSTLMKILAGVERPSAGSLELEGAAVSFATVRQAAEHGISIIFQELNLCPNLSIAENLFIGSPISRLSVSVDHATQRRRAQALLDRLGQRIDAGTLVSELRIGQQQIVEIAKALAEEARILIMDEPTSALSGPEVAILFRIIEELKASGVAIIYISHRLEELVRIGDYITVLRDGRIQATAAKADISVPWIIHQMVGPLETALTPAVHHPERVVLQAEKISLAGPQGRRLVDEVSFTLRSGEVVGFYGLLGAGRSELFECLLGVHEEAGGKLTIDGVDVTGMTIAERLRRGVALVPEDRQREGLVQSLSVRANLSLAALWRFAKFFRISNAAERSGVASMIRSLWIKVATPEVEVTALSGGNQQKVVIGKALLTKPKVLLLDEPSRGIDIGAKAEVFRAIRELADGGLAIAFATSDLKEVLALSDRVLVMAEGRIAGAFTRETMTEQGLVAAATPGAAGVQRAPQSW
jgi:erythritol transport system ATP-binding protein